MRGKFLVSGFYFAPRIGRSTRSAFRVEGSFVVVEKRWGTREVERGKGKVGKNHGQSWVGKMEGGCHKMPGGRVLGPLAGERGTGGKAGNIEREKKKYGQSLLFTVMLAGVYRPT